MDHPISKLDECVFDYLVSNKDKPRSLVKIFKDITKDTGHRCSTLGNNKDNESYKKKFISICYTLHKHYKNIKRRFQDDRLYLWYSTELSDIYKYDLDNDFSDDDELDNMPKDSSIDYILENHNDYKYFPLDERYDNYDNAIHILVRNGNSGTLKKLLDQFNIDLEARNSLGKTAMDIAVEKNNLDMITMLLDYKYKDKDFSFREKFNNKNKTVTNTNKILVKENKILERTVDRLEEDIYRLESVADFRAKTAIISILFNLLLVWFFIL